MSDIFRYTRLIQTWILIFILSATVLGISTITGESCPPCYVENPDYDPDNPYESDPPCIPAETSCVTQRAKLYDFTIRTHRTTRDQQPWIFIGSQCLDYNELAGYIYVCRWERLVKVKTYEVITRYYCYSWKTLCVCPYSYSSGIDSAKQRSEKFVSEEDKIEKRDTSVASSIFSGPGTGDMLCRISGQP